MMHTITSRYGKYDRYYLKISSLELIDKYLSIHRKIELENRHGGMAAMA